MYCTKCGTKILEGTSYCTNCGSKVVFEDEIKDNKTEVKTPVTNTAPKVNNNTQSDPELTKKVNLLCVISLICYFILPELILGLSSLIDAGSSYSSTRSNYSGAFSLLALLSYVAAIVLMIVARVKDPKNTFGKVLMILYIAFFVGGIFVIVFAIFACGAAIQGISTTNGCN